MVIISSGGLYIINFVLRGVPLHAIIAYDNSCRYSGTYYPFAPSILINSADAETWGRRRPRPFCRDSPCGRWRCLWRGAARWRRCLDGSRASRHPQTRRGSLTGRRLSPLLVSTLLALSSDCMGPAYLETRTVLLGVAVTLKTNLRCGAYVAKDGFLVKDGLLHGQEIRPCLIKNENLSTSSFHLLIYINDVRFACQSVMIFLTHLEILISHVDVLVQGGVGLCGHLLLGPEVVISSGDLKDGVGRQLGPELQPLRGRPRRRMALQQLSHHRAWRSSPLRGGGRCCVPTWAWTWTCLN